jgi:putative ABC transport system permease protein
VQYKGQAYAAWGLGPHPLYSYRLSARSWFAAADAPLSIPPVVLGPVIADAAGARVVDILGLVVVGITLMGLASALTMAVIERTREIAILRCLGARARQIGRIFSTEAVVLTLAGWALGILLGWLIYQGLLTLVRHEADLSVPQDFQPTIPLITLVGVLVLTLTVIRGPLRRATRTQPGTALRYQ